MVAFHLAAVVPHHAVWGCCPTNVTGVMYKASGMKQKSAVLLFFLPVEQTGWVGKAAQDTPQGNGSILRDDL